MLQLCQTSLTLSHLPHLVRICRSSWSSRVVQLLRCIFDSLLYSPACILIPSTVTQSYHSRPENSALITRTVTNLTYPLTQLLTYTSTRLLHLTLATCKATHLRTFTHRHAHRPGAHTSSQQPHLSRSHCTRTGCAHTTLTLTHTY